MDYSAYQLTDLRQIAELRRAHGERFLRFEEKLRQRLRDMPADQWVDYTAWVHPDNIEMAVKAICYYIGGIKASATILRSIKISPK